MTDEGRSRTPDEEADVGVVSQHEGFTMMNGWDDKDTADVVDRGVCTSDEFGPCSCGGCVL